MKLRNLLLTGLAAVGFLACSNDDDLGRDGGRATEGDAYASFTIDTRGLNLHTRAEESTDTGTEDEQAVKKVIAVMYDNNGVVAHQLEQDYESVKTNTVKLEAKSVKKQDYKVAIIVNPTDQVVTLTKTGKHMSLLLEGMVEGAKDASVFTKSGFMMSNANGLELVKADDLKDDAEAANAAPIKISVDRVVAKVRVSQVGDELETNGADKVVLKGWDLDVTNKKSYYLRKAALDMDGKPETKDTPRYKRYAQDPNFTLEDLQGVTYVGRLVKLAKNFNYVGYNGVTADYTMADKYVLENTFDEGVVSRSQATRVVLEADYLPAGLDQDQVKDGWFSYKDKQMSIEEFAKNFNTALTQEWDTSIEGLNSSFVNEMKNLAIFVVYLNDLKNGEEIDKKGDKQFLDEEGKLLPQYEGLLKVLNIGEITYEDLKKHISDKGVFSPVVNGSFISKEEVKITVNTEASFHAGNLKFYKDAKSYYPVYIKHFDYSEETNKDELKSAYGYYGVVRNNVYDVKINSISKPGMAVVVPPALEGGQPEISDRPTPDLDNPTDPDNPDNPVVKPEDPSKPDEPIIEDEFFISYDVEILPWFVRTQVEDL